MSTKGKMSNLYSLEMCVHHANSFYSTFMKWLMNQFQIMWLMTTSRTCILKWKIKRAQKWPIYCKYKNSKNDCTMISSIVLPVVSIYIRAGEGNTVVIKTSSTHDTSSWISISDARLSSNLTHMTSDSWLVWYPVK